MGNGVRGIGRLLQRGAALLRQAERRLLELLPGWICGRESLIAEKYRCRWGCRDWGPLIQKNRLRTLRIYLALLVLFLPLICIALIKPGEGGVPMETLERPAYGEKARSAELQAILRYEDITLAEDLTLTLWPRSLTEEQQIALLENLGARLPTLILGENESLDNVTGPLLLPERDSATGIRIQWESNRPELLDEEGRPDLWLAEGGEELVLTAVLSLGTLWRDEEIPLRLAETYGEAELAGALSGSLAKTVEALEESRGSEESLSLPDSLGPGISVRWQRQEESLGALLLCALAFCLLWTYFRRYDRVDRELKQAEAEIVREFPEMVNKLVLLLNAGMVVRRALEKIAEDYMRRQRSVDAADLVDTAGTVGVAGTAGAAGVAGVAAAAGVAGAAGVAAAAGRKRSRVERARQSLLYEELWRIVQRSAETNTPMVKELREFAARSGVRELMRFAAIVSDNMSKGSSLAEKLEAESALLWMGRKKRVEEQGRLAESKLTFPMMVLLLSLIMIVTAPALIGM